MIWRRLTPANQLWQSFICCNIPWVFSCRLFTWKINVCLRQEILSDDRLWLVQVARISGNIFPTYSHHLHLDFYSVSLVTFFSQIPTLKLSFLSKQMRECRCYLDSAITPFSGCLLPRLSRAMTSNPIFCILSTPSHCPSAKQISIYIQAQNGRKKPSLQSTISIYSGV